MKKNKFFLPAIVFSCLIFVSTSAHASWIALTTWVFSILTGLTVFMSSVLTLAGGDIFKFLYEQYSECYTCKYVARTLDYVIIGSNGMYESLAPYIIAAIPIIFIFYIFWMIITSFLSRTPLGDGKGRDINGERLYKVFGPKVFAMAIAFILLASPTPKLLFQYIINPSLSVAMTYGVKLTALGGSKNAENFFMSCMAEKQSWEDVVNYKDPEYNYFKDIKKQMGCLTQQAESINSIGLIVGNSLFFYSGHVKYNWIYLIPNLKMMAAGAIITGAYFAAAFCFAFYILEVFLQLYFIFLFLPFSILSYVTTRGQEPIPRINGIYLTSINQLINAVFTLIFLCLMLSIVNLVSQAAWSTSLGGDSYTSILKAIGDKNIDFIIDNVYLGSKSFFYLLFAPVISVFLLSLAPSLAGKLGIQLQTGLADSAWKVMGTATDKAKDGYKYLKDNGGKIIKMIRGKP